MAELIREQILFEAAVDEGVRDVLRRGAFGAGLLANTLAGQGEVPRPPAPSVIKSGEVQGPPAPPVTKSTWKFPVPGSPGRIGPPAPPSVTKTKPPSVTKTEPGSDAMRKVWGVDKELQGPPTAKQDLERIHKKYGEMNKKDAQKAAAKKKAAAAAAKKKADWTFPSQRKK